MTVERFVPRELVTVQKLHDALWPPLLTSLPTTAVDTDEIRFLADAAAGVVWHLKYDAATARWRYLGGPPLFAEIATSESSTSGTYAALATAGPSIVLPLAGDYDVEIGCRVLSTTNAAEAHMSYDIGATAASDADHVMQRQPDGVNSAVFTGSRKRRKTGLAAVTLTAKYRGTSTFANRWMSATPVRLS